MNCIISCLSTLLLKYKKREGEPRLSPSPKGERENEKKTGICQKEVIPV